MNRCFSFVLLALVVTLACVCTSQAAGDRSLAGVTSLQDSISGRVFNDLDGNSLFGTEPVLAGWVIVLHADSANGPIVQTATSDALGKYKFYIPKGTYAVTESLQTGWVVSKPISGSYSITTVDTAIQGFLVRDFGNYQLGILRIDLTIDQDGDGVKEAVDTSALSGGAKAVFRTKKGSAVYRLDTLGDGTRSLYVSDLLPGIYSVEQITKPTGWTQTYGALRTFSFTRSGKVDSSVYMDFQAGTIGGKAYLDANGNGTENSEPGLSGWVVELRRDTVTGTVLGRDTTDAGGLYQFSNIAVGKYSVNIVPQSGWIRTEPAGGTAYQHTAVSGLAVTADNFGYYQGGSVHGTIFYDRNGNGTQESGEDGLTGWTITAVNATPALNRSAKSQPGGAYIIDGLTPGSYTLSMTAKSGWSQTFPVSPYVITAAVGSDTTGLVFGNSPPVVPQLFRTFVSDSLNMKAAKKKRVETRFMFTFRNLTGMKVNGLYLKFNKAIVSIDSATALTTFTQTGSKEWTCTGDSLADSAYVTFYGTGPGKSVTVSKANWTLGGSIAGRKLRGQKPDSIQYLYNMPNGGNVVASVYSRGFAAFNRTAVTGMVLGTVRKDSARKYGWVYLKGATDFRNSMIDRGGKHTGQARGFSVYQNRTFVGQKTNIGPLRHNNVLVADLMALKLSIAASAYGITPPGLGELVYEEGTNPLSGKMLRDIASYTDSLLTYYAGQPSGVYTMLDTTIRKINATFSAPMDTLTFADSLTLPGVAGVAGVPYLRPTPPGVKPLVIYAPPVIEEEQEPDHFVLYQNYPNPFNPNTTISFDLPAISSVTVRIYNLLGQEVAVLADREEMEDGPHTLDFNASDMPSGVYFYRMTAEEIGSFAEGDIPRKFSEVKKMLLVK